MPVQIVYYHSITPVTSVCSISWCCCHTWWI